MNSVTRAINRLTRKGSINLVLRPQFYESLGRSFSGIPPLLSQTGQLRTEGRGASSSPGE